MRSTCSILCSPAGTRKNLALETNNLGDQYSRWTADHYGSQTFGPGNAAPDVTFGHMRPGLMATQNTMMAGILQLVPIPPADVPQHPYDQSYFTTDGMIGVAGGYIYFRDGSASGQIYRVQGTIEW